VWARDISPLRNVQTGSGGPPSLVFNKHRGSFPRTKRSQHGGNHSSLSGSLCSFLEWPRKSLHYSEHRTKQWHFMSQGSVNWGKVCNHTFVNIYACFPAWKCYVLLTLWWFSHTSTQIVTRWSKLGFCTKHMQLNSMFCRRKNCNCSRLNVTSYIHCLSCYFYVLTEKWEVQAAVIRMQIIKKWLTKLCL